MAITETKIQAIARLCNDNPAIRLEQPILSPSYYYQSLPICAIDAVFSIGVRYQNVVKVVNRFSEYEQISPFRAYGSTFPEKSSQYSVSTFITQHGNTAPELLAQNVFRNIQRTSPVNGILKAAAVQQWMKVLFQNGIDTFQDLDAKFQKLSYNAKCLDGLDRGILKIPGQKSGISLGYFYMLAGRDNLIKPDRMIMRFLRREFQSADLPVSEAKHVIERLVSVLRNQYTHKQLTVRDLDHAIWQYERSKEAR